MPDMPRRRAVALAAAAAGAAGFLPACVGAEPFPDQVQTASRANDRWAIERERVRAIGFTDAEAECWELVARAAGSFFALPQLHPIDNPEVTQAIHVIQNKLMSRPTYRRYRELARQRSR